MSVANVSRVEAVSSVGSNGPRHRVQVDDAEDRLGAVALLICDVMADRAEVVADVLLACRLNAGKDTRHM